MDLVITECSGLAALHYLSSIGSIVYSLNVTYTVTITEKKEFVVQPAMFTVCQLLTSI